MAGDLVSFVIDNQGVLNKLERVSHITDDFSVPLERCGIVALRAIDKHFKNQEGPEHQWPRLKDSTLARRREGAKEHHGEGRPLQDTGRLRMSSTHRGADGNIWRIDRRFLDVGTNLVYARIHNRGGDIQRAAGTVHHRLDEHGNLSRQPGHPNLAVFARKSETHVRETPHAAYVIHIPARPFVWLSQVDSDKMLRIFGDWADDKLKEFWRNIL